MSKKKDRKKQSKRNQEDAMFKKCREMDVNFEPMNLKQSILWDALENSPMAIGVGSAGSGKSHIGINAAVESLLNGKVKKIVVTRNPIPTGQSMGFFPGDMDTKLGAWLAPVIASLVKLLGFPLYQHLKDKGKIVFMPMEVLKGMDFHRSFVIVEEAQECTMEQLKVLATRIGKGSTLFINGDIEQRNEKISGRAFEVFIQAIENENNYIHSQLEMGNEMPEWEQIEIPVVRFEDDDCVRSKLCRKILHIFNTSNI